MDAVAVFLFGFGCIVFLAISVFVLLKIYKENVDLFKKIIHYFFILIFFVIFSAGLMMLGFRAEDRNSTSRYEHRNSVSTIWGGAITQNPPNCYYKKKTTQIEKVENKVTGKMEDVEKVIYVNNYLRIIKTNVKANLKSNYRKKGLLWYSGYNLKFSATFVVTNPLLENKKIYFHFPIPENSGNLTNFTIKENSKAYTEDQDVSDGITWVRELMPRDKVSIQINYEARGMGSFNYLLGSKKTEHPEFFMEINGDYNNVDYPYNCMSPTEVSSTTSELGNEIHIIYDEKNLITTQNIGVIVPDKTNIGSVIGRFLLFFSCIIIIISTCTCNC